VKQSCSATGFLIFNFVFATFVATFSFSQPASAQASSSQTASQSNTSEPVTLPPPKFFYSTEYVAGKVGGYLVNPSTGELSSNGQPPVWAHWGPTRIASDSGGYRLYVANQGSQDVSAYFIYRNTGWLYPVPGANFPVGGVSTDIAVHPSNKFVYVSTVDAYGWIQGKSNSVTAFSVASNGSLVPVPGSPFITGGENWGMAVDPSGQYLYASGMFSDSTGEGVINAFSIDQATGALAPIPGSPFPIIGYKCSSCSGPEQIYGMAVDPTGNFLIGGGNYNGVVYVYRIEAGTGSLSEVAGSPFVELLPSGGSFPSIAGAEPMDVSVTPNDQYVFVSNNHLHTLAMYDFDSTTGALSNITFPAQPYGTFVVSSSSVRSDPSGQFVYTLGYLSAGSQTKPGMIGYAIGSDGSTMIVPNAPYPDPGANANGYPYTDGIAVAP
jgi:6-phosphogluconolactonase (cycloisomerase 2 family)